MPVIFVKNVVQLWGFGADYWGHTGKNGFYVREKHFVRRNEFDFNLDVGIGEQINRERGQDRSQALHGFFMSETEQKAAGKVL